MSKRPQTRNRREVLAAPEFKLEERREELGAYVRIGSLLMTPRPGTQRLEDIGGEGEVTFSPVFLALAPLYRAEVLSDVIGLLEREYRAAYDQIGPGAANLPDLPEPRRTGEAKQQLDPRLRGPAEGEA